MPANVNMAFKRGVNVLFGDKPANVPENPPANVFAAWNRLAAKFPDIYPFAVASKKARETEEKLAVLLKADRKGLAALFARRLEADGAESVEKALENWWKEASRG